MMYLQSDSYIWMVNVQSIAIIPIGSSGVVQLGSTQKVLHIKITKCFPMKFILLALEVKGLN